MLCGFTVYRCIICLKELHNSLDSFLNTRTCIRVKFLESQSRDFLISLLFFFFRVVNCKKLNTYIDSLTSPPQERRQRTYQFKIKSESSMFIQTICFVCLKVKFDTILTGQPHNPSNNNNNKPQDYDVVIHNLQYST